MDVAVFFPVVESVVSTRLEHLAEDSSPRHRALVLMLKSRFLSEQFPDAPFEFLANVCMNQHIVTPKELLLLQLDLVPRRVPEHRVEAGALGLEEDLGELELPVEEPLPLPHTL